MICYNQKKFLFYRNGFISVQCLTLHQRSLCSTQESSEECDDDRDDSTASRLYLSPLFLRLTVIFVYTEVIIRSVQTTAASAPSHQRPLFSTTGHLFDAFFSTGLFSFLVEVRIWRLLQLFVVVLTYVYRLFPVEDEPEDFGW